MERFTVQDLPVGGRKSEERSGTRFARRLHTVRNDLDATLAELAKCAGMTESALAAIERGREVPPPSSARVPSPQAVVRILVACGVSKESACVGAAASYEAAAKFATAASLLGAGSPLLTGILPVLWPVPVVAAAAAVVNTHRKPQSLAEARDDRLVSALQEAAAGARRHPRATEYSLYDLPPREQMLAEIDRLSRDLPPVVLAAVVDELQAATARFAAQPGRSGSS
ncbi:MAG TPA: helix-turn-helix transcriptional regulator [Egibacteraceae bacterium]|nr:helix-turn-helix transcriptional regulator [Egibacteraceae bacterium]